MAPLSLSDGALSKEKKCHFTTPQYWVVGPVVDRVPDNFINVGRNQSVVQVLGHHPVGARGRDRRRGAGGGQSLVSDPNINSAVQTILQPKFNPYYVIAIGVVTELARRRTAGRA
jgi:hypothetical protein